MPITEAPKTICIINDCTDDNTRGRQGTRVGALFGLTPTYVGVPDYSTLAAGGNMIDMLDAVREAQAIILANVAPRFGVAQQFENGTPFGYFRYQNTLIVATVSGYTLSLVKKFGLADSITLLDMHTSVPEFVQAGMMSSAEGEDLLSTQFRSFNFSPRVAQYLTYHGQELPGQQYAMGEVADVPRAVWWVDNFGNLKTTITTDDANWEPGQTIELANEPYRMYDRLKDVPDGEVACIVGSSGLGTKRFLELVIQGERAADRLGLVVGDEL